jgi:hypothetical protein
VISLSRDQYGCRVMQKFLSSCQEEHRARIVAVLMRQDLASLIQDPHANHVMHRLMELLPAEQTQAIQKFYAGNVGPLSRHKYASRVLLRVLRHGDPSLVAALKSELAPFISELAYDQFGNYAVQELIEHAGTCEERGEVLQSLRGGFVRMSMQKYASNVVEKSLRFGTKEEREGIIAEIIDGESFTLDKEMGSGDLALPLHGTAVSPLVAIMVHPYGNYVVQRMVEYSRGAQLERIVAKIAMLEGGLEKGKFGKHILANLQEQRGQATSPTAEVVSSVQQQQQKLTSLTAQSHSQWMIEIRCSPMNEIRLDAPPGARNVTAAQ